MIKYYHYSSIEAGKEIINCQEIRATIAEKDNKKKKDAFFGSGVYLTVIPPAPGHKKKILQNNWRNTKCFQKVEMFFEIDIPKDDKRIKACDDPTGRFISLYSGTLDLDNYNWKSGTYEDTEISQEHEDFSEVSKLQRKKGILAKRIANQFIDAVAGDLFPWYGLSALFGVENRTGKEIPQNIRKRKIQDIVFGAWRSLYISEREYEVPYITRENVAKALMDGNLDNKFQDWIELLVTKQSSGYTDELAKRGFPAIHWVSLSEWMECNMPSNNEEAPNTTNKIQNRYDVCSQPTQNRCKNCKKGRFCTKEHQRMYWTFHKIFCKQS